MVLVIDKGEIIEKGTHKELMEMKGFYYRIYMSQFKGTNGDVVPIRLIPAEASTPHFIPQERSNIGNGGMIGMGQGRIMEIVETFKKNGATSPETAMSPEEMGLPPMFRFMLQGLSDKSGIFLEHNGKYYISEDQTKRMQKRLGRE